jgi:hypothetical protein
MSFASLREGAVSRFALLALSMSLVACGTKLDVTKVTKAISDGINTQVALPIASVDCGKAPTDVKAGTTFDCIATPSVGGKVTVKVTENDNAGNVSWEITNTEGLLNLEILEKSIAAGLKEKLDADATVSCGGRWRAAKTGDTFECEEKESGGATAKIIVTTTDDSGKVTWKVAEAPAPEAPAQ